MSASILNCSSACFCSSISSGDKISEISNELELALDKLSLDRFSFLVYNFSFSRSYFSFNSPCNFIVSLSIASSFSPCFVIISCSFANFSLSCCESNLIISFSINKTLLKSSSTSSIETYSPVLGFFKTFNDPLRSTSLYCSLGSPKILPPIIKSKCV